MYLTRWVDEVAAFAIPTIHWKSLRGYMAHFFCHISQLLSGIPDHRKLLRPANNGCLRAHLFSACSLSINDIYRRRHSCLWEIKFNFSNIHDRGSEVIMYACLNYYGSDLIEYHIICHEASTYIFTWPLTNNVWRVSYQVSTTWPLPLFLLNISINNWYSKVKERARFQAIYRRS